MADDGPAKAQRDYGKIERIRQDGTAELNQTVDTGQKAVGVGVGASYVVGGVFAGATWPVAIACGAVLGLAAYFVSGASVGPETGGKVKLLGDVRAEGTRAINDNANSAKDRVKAAQAESDRNAAAANQSGRREVEREKTGEAAALDPQGR